MKIDDEKLIKKCFNDMIKKQNKIMDKLINQDELIEKINNIKFKLKNMESLNKKFLDEGAKEIFENNGYPNQTFLTPQFSNTKEEFRNIMDILHKYSQEEIEERSNIKTKFIKNYINEYDDIFINCIEAHIKIIKKYKRRIKVLEENLGMAINAIEGGQKIKDGRGVVFNQEFGIAFIKILKGALDGEK